MVQSGLRASFCLALLAVAAGLPGPPPRCAESSLTNYAQPALRDLNATVAVLSRSDAELRKISKDYAQVFKLTSQEINYKEPLCFRFQGKRGPFTFRSITNGTRRLTEASGLPLLSRRSTEDISQKPGKANTIADLGIITPGWAALMESQWLRSEERDRRTLQVFRCWYHGDPGLKHLLWVDPSTNTLVEHVIHDRQPEPAPVRKRFVFSEVKQIGGVWVPTQVALYNRDNHEAAVVRYEHIRVNAGLPDSLFAF